LYVLKHREVEAETSQKCQTHHYTKLAISPAIPTKENKANLETQQDEELSLKNDEKS
jgi:hypothetical protein